MNDREPLNPLFAIDSLLPALEAGHTVVTSNLRLSRTIRDAWHRDRQGRGLATWSEPAILPLDSWLEQCWLDLLDRAHPATLAGPCIKPHQEALLWRQVIAADRHLPATANPDNFAELARSGWKLVRQWRIDPRALEHNHHIGARHLLRWGGSFEQALASRRLISPEQRADIVREGFADGTLPPLDTLVTVGFQTLPPLNRAVLDGAARHLVAHRPACPPSSCFRASAEDGHGEIALAAHWAKARAAAFPGGRIGVVIPRLTSIQPQVERIFSAVLDPERALPFASYRPAPYNISAARPLAEAPLVAAALALLSLFREKLPVGRLNLLLPSPFWGDAEGEAAIRCRASTALLSLGLHELPPGRLRKLLHQLEGDCHQDEDDSPPSVRLARLAALQRTLPARQSHAAWRHTFDEALAIVGWPGSRALDSQEFQQQDHWRQLLDTLETLDTVSGPVDCGDALGQLAQLAADSQFHAETPDRPIQILGTLEAAGLRFDHLWVMNMEDSQWPEPVSPHPLLPVDLQRQHQMPRSLPERELALSRALFELFSTSAGEVVFSHARREGDIHLQPSVLLDDLPPLPNADDGVDGHGSPIHPWWQPLRESGELELLVDDTAPPCRPPDHRLVGGSRFISDQAQCPFNAFARWRLGASAPQQPVSGLGAMWRGILVHDALERFWRHTGDHGTLCGLGDNDRAARLRDAVAGAMDNLFRRQNGLLTEADFGHRLLAMERQRLVQLLDGWLQLEMERPPFRVEQSEMAAEVALGEFRLRLRLDRVDRLADGRPGIIDYKTGRAGIAAVTGERLLEAQLPLYALALHQATGELPALVAYGRIHVRDTGFDGLCDDEDLLSGCRPLAARGLPETWQDTLALWRAELEALAGEIRDGRADVTFYGGDAQARNGELLPLNRWPDRERLAGLAGAGHGGSPP